VCRQRPELWVTVGYMKLCVDRDMNCRRCLVLSSWQYLKSQIAVPSSLCRKAEQQSVAVLHSTWFCRKCHCSTNFVKTVYLQSLPLCTTSNRPLQYSLYNQYNTQLLKLSLGCNSTAIYAMLSFDELYSKISWVLTTFHHSSPNSM